MSLESIASRLRSMGMEKVCIRGEEVFCCCPFHDDTNPSFSVNPSRGSHCFVCDKGNFHTVEALFKNLKGGEKGDDSSSDTEAMRSVLRGIFDRKEEVNPVFDPRILNFYCEDDDHFVKSWGVSTSIVKRRKLLIDPDTEAECFPIFDHNKNFYGCVKRREGPHRSIYHYPKDFKKGKLLLGEDAPGRNVWVVEGVRDLCVLESLLSPLKDTLVVALGGAIATKDQIDRLKRYRKVTLCLDNDPAGYGGTKKLIESLTLANLYLATYEGKDPASATSNFSVKRACLFSFGC